MVGLLIIDEGGENVGNWMEKWYERQVPEITPKERMDVHNVKEVANQQRQRRPVGHLISRQTCPKCGGLTQIILKGRFGNITYSDKHECPGEMDVRMAKNILRKYAPWKLRLSHGKTDFGRDIPLFTTARELVDLALRAKRGEFDTPPGWYQMEDGRWKVGAAKSG